MIFFGHAAKLLGQRTGRIAPRALAALSVPGALSVIAASGVQAQNAPPATPPPTAGVTTQPAAPAASAAPAWEKLKAAHAYSLKAPLAVREEPREDAEYKDYKLWHVSFPNLKGQAVPGLFLRPKAEGVYPCVLILHGMTSDKETFVRYFGRPLAERGIASLAIDADLHGERRDKNAPASFDPLTLGQILRGGVVDNRLALDYLKTRADVDGKRIGLFGYSMGAMMGAVVSGVDERLAAAVLCVGGDPVRRYAGMVPGAMRSEVEAISPSNYIGHISPRPVFLINGTRDTIMPEADARLLQNAAREPKRILWADAGHILPEEAVAPGLDWLRDKLAAAPVKLIKP